VNVQVLADPAGRLIWASAALPGARHDMGAAREHGLIEALHAAEVRVIADSGYRGSGFAVPQRRRPADPETGRRRLSRNQREVNAATLVNAARANGRTPSSKAGASCAKSAAAHVEPPPWSRPSWSSSWLAKAKWNGLNDGSEAVFAATPASQTFGRVKRVFTGGSGSAGRARR
jgi:hypothetical protein